MAMATKKMVKGIAKKNKMLSDVLIEREVLAKIRSPFCVNLHYSYQDDICIYLTLTLVRAPARRARPGCSARRPVPRPQPARGEAGGVPLDAHAHAYARMHARPRERSARAAISPS